jgi:hypothetical protein
LATASRNMREWLIRRRADVMRVPDECDHEGRQGLGDFRIGLEIGQASRRRNFLAAFDHRLGPEFKSCGRIQHRLIERIARRDAAWQIRKPDADNLAFFIFDDGGVMGHASISPPIPAHKQITYVQKPPGQSVLVFTTATMAQDAVATI